jgi:preprotein translocase subunit SecG
MMILLLMLHIIACLILILVVLLQSGKAADLSAFAGGGSQTAFGARGAQTVLSKLTTGAAVMFMCTSLGLGILSSREAESVFEDVPAGEAVEETGQAVPGETGAPDVPPAPPADSGAATGSGTGAGEEGAADTGGDTGDDDGGDPAAEDDQNN